MNFRQAVTVHARWKMKVARYLSCPDGSLQFSAIRQDFRCELGKWIHGEGKSFEHLAEYQKLVKDHARVHEYAGDLVRRADLGEPLSEASSMGDRSPYGIAAQSLVSSLQSLQSRTGL